MIIDAIGWDLRTGRVDDAHELGRRLSIPSRRNAPLPPAVRPPRSIGEPGGLRWPVDVYRDGAFFARVYSTMSAEGIKRAFEEGDPASHWVVLD